MSKRFRDKWGHRRSLRTGFKVPLQKRLKRVSHDADTRLVKARPMVRGQAVAIPSKKKDGGWLRRAARKLFRRQAR